MVIETINRWKEASTWLIANGFSLFTFGGIYGDSTGFQAEIINCHEESQYYHRYLKVITHNDDVRTAIIKDFSPQVEWLPKRPKNQ